MFNLVMILSALVLLLQTKDVTAHGIADMPVNPVLGVPGFPDCERAHPELQLSIEDAAQDLICHQKGDASAIKIGCVGDSITAGVHSSGGIHPYPAQLQLMLDASEGKGKYAVTNMGACGSMMLKNSSSPFWLRPQFKTLIANKWDIVTIMLGTNDAHNDCNEPGSRKGCTSDWNKDCGGPNNTSLNNCTFADDFASMVNLIKTLGTTPAGPKIYVMVPPPLMAANNGWPTMQTTINTLFPKLIPLMQAATKGVQSPPIDVYTGMGGTPDWKGKFPASCALNSPWGPCAWWCDHQSCDQCHPDDNGYTHLAKIVYSGLGFGRLH